MAFPLANSGQITTYPEFGVTKTHPEYSGNFIPPIWTTKVLQEFYHTSILSSITNTDYEGSIKNHGDKIIVRTMPQVSVRPYQIGQELQTEFPAGDIVEMFIDKGLYWNSGIDDIVRKQTDINMIELWAKQHAEVMKRYLDTEILSYKVGEISANHTDNITVGTPSAGETVDASNVLEVIIAMGEKMDERAVPEDGRFLIIPFWLASQLKLSELRDASLAGDSKSMLRNGQVGVIDRFTVWSSPYLPTDSANDTYDSAIIAGTKHATSFATQLTKTETIRMPNTFGDTIRGLMVYGYKMFRPEALEVAFINRA